MLLFIEIALISQFPNLKFRLNCGIILNLSFLILIAEWCHFFAFFVNILKLPLRIQIANIGILCYLC